MKTYTMHKKSRQEMFREVVFRHGGTFRFAKISGQTEADVYNRLPCDAREEAGVSNVVEMRKR